MSGITHILNTTMDVYSPGTARTSSGAVDEDGIVLKSSGVLCLLDRASGFEREVLGREGLNVTHWIFADVGTSVLSQDIVKIGSRTFDVQADADDVQERGHHLEIRVVERT